jgi:hypothetical protein
LSTILPRWMLVLSCCLFHSELHDASFFVNSCYVRYWCSTNAWKKKTVQCKFDDFGISRISKSFKFTETHVHNYLKEKFQLFCLRTSHWHAVEFSSMSKY